jgi:hypothetical protein
LMSSERLTLLVDRMMFLLHQHHWQADFLSSPESILLLTAADHYLFLIEPLDDSAPDQEPADREAGLVLLDDLLTAVVSFQQESAAVENLEKYLQKIEHILVLLTALMTHPERLLGFYTYCMLMRKAIWSLKWGSDPNALPLEEKEELFEVTPADENWALFWG